MEVQALRIIYVFKQYNMWRREKIDNTSKKNEMMEVQALRIRHIITILKVNEWKWENTKLSNIWTSWIKAVDNQWDDGSTSFTDNIHV